MLCVITRNKSCQNEASITREDNYDSEVLP